MLNLNKYTFIDIFESLQIKKIVIPEIQRDYAQGRDDSEAKRIRKDFLNVLQGADPKNPVTLDFIYGNIKDGNMFPLDGQQRLTTLFLLHWYAAVRDAAEKKEKIESENYSCLRKFSYAVRYSSRDFCEKLSTFQPKFNNKLSEEIENQPWFSRFWKKDATIKSMLRMLDEIHEKFGNTENLWEKLKQKAISFYFLNIDMNNLTDDLYIKMNSRGRLLTRFENFKAELIKLLNQLNLSDIEKNDFTKKTDNEWTDFFWQYHTDTDSSDNIELDQKIFNYFLFICRITDYKTYTKQNTETETSEDKLPTETSKDKWEEEYGKPLLEYIENQKISIQEIKNYFDCWEKENTKEFFEKFISINHETNKITYKKIGKKIDLLNDYVADEQTKKRMLLLYAFVYYLQNKEQLTEDNFRRRIRIISNLIKNTTDKELTEGLRVQAMITQTEHIISTGQLLETKTTSFNQVQMNEEKEKIEFLEKNPNYAEKLFQLEDHEKLHGQVSILIPKVNDEYDYKTGIDKYKPRFESLLACDEKNIVKALLTFGDYGIKSGKKYLYALDDKFFQEKEKVKKILLQLLDEKEEFSNDFLKEIADNYIKRCEDQHKYSLQYYFIKYFSSFWRDDSSEHVYHKENNDFISVIKNKNESSTAYNPYFKEIYEQLKENSAAEVSLAENKRSLNFKDKNIQWNSQEHCFKCDEDSEPFVPIEYDVINIDEENSIKVDKEDRIEKLIDKIKLIAKINKSE